MPDIMPNTCLMHASPTCLTHASCMHGVSWTEFQLHDGARAVVFLSLVKTASAVGSAPAQYDNSDTGGCIYSATNASAPTAPPTPPTASPTLFPSTTLSLTIALEKIDFEIPFEF